LIAPPQISQPKLCVQDLFDAQKKQLQLKWLAGESGNQTQLEPAQAKFPGLALVGHLNFVHPNRVQVLGRNEISYLDSLDDSTRKKSLNELFNCETTIIIIVSGGSCPDDLLAGASKSNTPLFLAGLSSPIIIENLQYYLTRALAPLLTAHGVFMEVMGTGLFIRGESGIGKSELAMELLSRNHRLIADDAVEIVRVGPDVLVGQCPETLVDFMEVRGLGIINVRAMFGETAIRRKKKLHLILTLKQLKTESPDKIDRLQAQQMTSTLLDVDIPEIILYVAPGRNLAVLVEAAARTYMLRVKGIDAYQEFSSRQQKMILKNTNESDNC
jgi:HPr kinase/phosphorylase